jgi:hypothetical protein
MGRGKSVCPEFHPAEGAAEVPGSGSASVRATSLATLLSSHILRDGELVLMVLKPSYWFLIFSSATFSGITVAAAILLALLDRYHSTHFYIQAAAFVIACRLMWAVLQWMGRLYILTDMRVMRISGVFFVDLFDCPLRKVVRTRIVSPMRERIVFVGSIEIIPKDETMATAIWETVAKPALVHEQLVSAINRARQSGMGGE